MRVHTPGQPHLDQHGRRGFRRSGAAVLSSRMQSGLKPRDFVDRDEPESRRRQCGWLHTRGRTQRLAAHFGKRPTAKRLRSPATLRPAWHRRAAT